MTEKGVHPSLCLEAGSRDPSWQASCRHLVSGVNYPITVVVLLGTSQSKVALEDGRDLSR